VVDLRWQMVLDRLGSEEPAFGQGTLSAFRARLIRHDMDRRLLERTVELARTTKAFDFKKLPKTLRVAVDSSPLEGAGRVEDTINLLGHAARKVAACAADLLGWPLERVAKEAGIPVLLEASIKVALDLEWSAPDAAEITDLSRPDRRRLRGRQPARDDQPDLHQPVQLQWHVPARGDGAGSAADRIAWQAHYAALAAPGGRAGGSRRGGDDRRCGRDRARGVPPYQSSAGGDPDHRPPQPRPSRCHP